MYFGTGSRTATAVLGITLGLGLLAPLSVQTSASAQTPAAPTEAGPAVTEPATPTPLGDVSAQPAPSEREEAAMAARAATLPEYTIVDLSGGHAGFAAEVNEAGVVAGTIFPDGTADAGRHARPVVWVNGVRHALDAGPAASPIVHAGALGDDGTVGGWEFDVATRTRYAVRWVRDEDGVYGPKERISPVEHDSFDSTGGEVQTISPDGALHVTQPTTLVPSGSDMVWEDGTAYEINGIAGQYPYLSTWDMNASRQLAGSLSTGTRMEGAYWPAGPHPEVLERLIPESTWNQALALNDHGDVVMESFRRGVESGSGVDRRVIAVGSGARWTRLPDLYGNGDDDDSDSNLFPTDINDRGDVVGEALIGIDGRETTYAWLFREGSMIDLNGVVPLGDGWELNAAYSINERGQIVGVGTHNGVRKPFMLDPTRPLLFVPGAGASILKSYDNIVPRELWVGCGEDRLLLSLFPEDNPAADVRAVDATRYMDCYKFSGKHFPPLDAYGTLLDTLTTEHGYREYLVEERAERFTSEGCDLTQRGRSPNLFVFAYDWRQDNRLSAEKLGDFIDCIRRFYPDTEIDVLTHSMGSVVARRHILMNPGTTGFHKVVTIGAPWLGAPKLVNVLNTGNFAKPVAYGPDVAHIVSGFPAAHQLMSGPLYHQYVAPAFEEDGWDYDGDGEDREEYDWDNLEQTFDRRWSRTTPAATAAEFQRFGGADGQADWSADTSGIDYVHIFGVQSGEKTLGRTIATTETSCSWLPFGQCTTTKVYKAVTTEGDGTVPTMSAERVVPGADLNADGATLVQIDGTGFFDDLRVEHTTLTQHPDAIRTMIAAFQGREGALRRLAAESTTDRRPSPNRYVTVTGAADVVLSDGRGNDDAPLGTRRPRAPARHGALWTGRRLRAARHAC